jgi:CIC family chloride channel protein
VTAAAGPWRRFIPSRERLSDLRGRWHRVLVLSAVTGLITSLTVVGFTELTEGVLLDHLLELAEPALVVAPVVGLIIAWALLRFAGRHATPAISDEYLRAYHGRPCRRDVRAFGSRVAASVATLGSGGAMGFEGPSMFLGASTGRWLQDRYRRFFRAQDTHVLLVAGAAAGVAAIFKAPATGAIFALEVPYQQDNASHAVLPALIASATSYLTFVLFEGTDRLFPVSGVPGFDARDLLGALGIGLLCGLGARLFATVIVRVKQVQRRTPASRALLIAGIGMALLTALSLLAFDQPLSLGPGYDAIAWAQDPSRSVWLVLLLMAVRPVATTLTLVGGGAGGLFIPLFVEGWLVGTALEAILATDTSLFPVIGAAAFLGAGYRTPIAAVVFVAEATGRPGFIVPALLATAVAQLLMGSKSITEYQLPRRVSALKRRLEQPVSVAVQTDDPTCTSSTMLARVVRESRSGASMPVVDDGSYRGMVSITRAVVSVDPADWGSTSVAAWIDPVEPVGEDWPVRRALDALKTAGLDLLPVVDTGGAYVGVVHGADLMPDDAES